MTSLPEHLTERSGKCNIDMPDFKYADPKPVLHYSKAAALSSVACARITLTYETPFRILNPRKSKLLLINRYRAIDVRSGL